MYYFDSYTSGPLDPDVADLAPSDPALTAYDEQYVITYLSILNANADGATGAGVADRAAY